MRFVRRNALSWTLSALLPAMPVYPAAAAQNTPVAGVVVEADQAHLGNGNGVVTSGASIYSGDVIKTDENGHAQVRIGQTRFELEGDTQVAFFSGATGAVVELRHGVIHVAESAAGEPFEIFASDIRVIPTADRPILGTVKMVSPCDVQISSQHGNMQARAGKEDKTIEDTKSYDVRPEYTVDDNRIPAISPDDNDFHRGHRHANCAAADLHGAHAPIAAASSHFALAAGVGIGVITVIGIKKALESPDRP